MAILVTIRTPKTPGFSDAALTGQRGGAIRREHVGHASDVHRVYTHREVAATQAAFAALPRLLPAKTA